MNHILAQQAIALALKREWKEAIEINREILRENPGDIDALNRIAKAFFEIGEINKAKDYTQKALVVDPLNSIAQRCLTKYLRIGYLGTNGQTRETCYESSLEVFLEEPGKTKIIPLLHLGDCQVILSLDSGNLVQLFPSKHRVTICTPDGRYIGRLPDDMASRIINLVRGGNEYQAFIKSAMPDEVIVFIKEVKRTGRPINNPSFPFEKRRTNENDSS